MSHATMTHVSILKMISHRFRLGYLTKRHRYSSDIGRTFDFSKPNFDVPHLPSPAPAIGLPCLLKASPAQARATRREGPELADIAAYAESLGVEIKPPTPERVFAHPGRAREIGKLWREAARRGEI